MGTLRYAILGLLNRRSMTGYDLKKEFETTLSEFWSAKHSQIYPELKELTIANLVSFEVEISGEVLEKKVYSITPKGVALLHNWLLTNEETYLIPKDEFKLRLFFSDLLATKERLALIKAQYQLHLAKMKHLEDNLKKFASIPPQELNHLTDYLVLLGGIKREKMFCEWLEECQELLGKVE